MKAKTSKNTTRKKKAEVHVQEVYIPPVTVDNSKQEAIAALKSKGFDAYSEDGVIMVSFEYNDGTEQMNKMLSEVEKVLAEVGYDRSYGCRAKRV